MPSASQRSSSPASSLVSRSNSPGSSVRSCASMRMRRYMIGASSTAWCTSSRTLRRSRARISCCSAGMSSSSMCIHDSTTASSGTGALSSMSSTLLRRPSASRWTTICGCSTRSAGQLRRSSSARSESTRYGTSPVTMSTAVVSASRSVTRSSVSPGVADRTELEVAGRQPRQPLLVAAGQLARGMREIAADEDVGIDAGGKIGHLCGHLGVPCRHCWSPRCDGRAGRSQGLDRPLILPRCGAELRSGSAPSHRAQSTGQVCAGSFECMLSM